MKINKIKTSTGKSYDFSSNVCLIKPGEKGKNQQGKTTLIDMILYIFNYDRNYFDNKLKYSGSKELDEINFSVEIDKNIFKTQRSRTVGKNVKDKNNKILIGNTEIDCSSIPSYIESVPLGINAHNISRTANIITKLEEDSFSFGIYYQIFVIDEKLGWTKYNVQKTKSSAYYSRDRINIYLYSLFVEKNEVDEFFNELKNFSNADIEYMRLNSQRLNLISMEKTIEANTLKKYLSNHRNSEINKKIEYGKELMINLIAVKDQISKKTRSGKNVADDKESLKRLIFKSENIFGDIFDSYNKSELLVSYDSNIEEIQKDIESLEAKKKELMSMIKENNKDINKNARDILKLKSHELKLSDSDFIDYLYKDDIKKEIKESKDEISARGANNDLSEILNSISDKIQREICSEQTKIIDFLMDKMKAIYSNKEELLKKFEELLGGMKEGIWRKEYFAQGALENVQVLSERLAIITKCKTTVPIFIVDSPYKAEINPNEEDTNIISFLVNELLILFAKQTENGKLGQLIISTAEPKKIEKRFVNEDIDFKNIIVDGLE